MLEVLRVVPVASVFQVVAAVAVIRPVALAAVVSVNTLTAVSILCLPVVYLSLQRNVRVNIDLDVIRAVFDGGRSGGFDPPQEVADPPQKVLQNLFGGRL